MTATIAIINYGMGNLGSILAALKLLSGNCIVSGKLAELDKADAFILPGVGAFPQSMRNLKATGFDTFLREQVLEGRKPFLGICLGMQLLAQDSCELEQSDGLGFIEGHVNLLEPGAGLRVPQVGWNQTSFAPEHPLFHRIEPNAHFYYDHSYHFVAGKAADVAATCDYGGKCVAALSRDNIFAVQFHPEKSQRNGLKLLRNFMNITDSSAAQRCCNA